MSTYPICTGTYSPHFKTHPAWQSLKSVLDENNFVQEIEQQRRVDVEVSALIGASTPKTKADLEINVKLSAGDFIHLTTAVFVVSPSCLKPTRRATTEVKLKAFVDDYYHEAGLIAVLCREVPRSHDSKAPNSLRVLMDLYQLLIPAMPKQLPVVAIFDPAEFATVIVEFLQKDVGVMPSLPSREHGCPFTLLSRHAQIEGNNVDPVEILGTLFPSMRALSQAIRTERGRDLMTAFFHEGQTETLARFMLQDSRVD